MGKPVHVLVMAVGAPLPMAAVHARSWWEQAVASCRGGDDAEVMAGSSWHGASLWCASPLGAALVRHWHVAHQPLWAGAGGTVGLLLHP